MFGESCDVAAVATAAMNEADRRLVVEVSERNLGRRFDLPAVLAGCAADGGHDFSGPGLTLESLYRVWRGEESKHWDSLGFFAGELLAYYAAFEAPLNAEKTVQWLVAVFLVKNAIKQGYSSWDLQIDKILCVLGRTDGAINELDKIAVLKALVCEQLEPPRPKATNARPEAK